VIRIDRAAVLALGVSAAAGFALLVAPDHAARVGHLWLVAILSIALAAALGLLGRAVPRRRSAFDAVFAPLARSQARPASLSRVEREVTLATGTAFDVHYRLRPIVRELAAGLLLQRGVDLDRSPARAEALLGPRVWELARPGRPAPEDRTAPGLPVAAVASVVEDLERLACS
jgi:hypothetical protein